MVGNPIKMSALGEPALTGAPNLGEHNQHVLAGLLGYPPERIAEILAPRARR